MTRILIPSVVIAVFAACEVAETTVAPPTLSDVSAERSAVALVDRAALLEGALDYDQATSGTLLDMSSDGVRMAFTGEDTVDTDGVPTERDGDFAYSNIWAGASAVAFAETVRHAVVGPPQIAIAFAADGNIVQTEPNVWVATNTIELPEGPLTATFAVAWVGVGWLGEMRYTNATASDVLWFNGFMGNEGHVGWWDLYGEGEAQAVVEWIGDGEGNGQFGMAAVAGDEAGSAISYWFTPEADRIDFIDGATGETAYVVGYPDGSGEVQLVDFNGGQAACWDSENLNTACPEL